MTTHTAVLTQSTFETIEWSGNTVVMIDQTRLPRETIYVTCRTYVEVADAIRNMIIRGAPAIGVAAAMGVALGALQSENLDEDRKRSLTRWIFHQLNQSSR